MKKHTVTHEEVSPVIVWMYAIDNLNDFDHKIVLSRRFITGFMDVFDEFRIRNVRLTGNYAKECHNG